MAVPGWVAVAIGPTAYGVPMSRMNDVGGMQGFGAIDPREDAAPFHDDWEAHVFALNAALLGRGVYNLDEFRDAIERMPPADYLAASYYERWFTAIRTLLVEKGVITQEDMDAVLSG
jgi:nitrile hydratase